MPFLMACNELESNLIVKIIDRGNNLSDSTPTSFTLSLKKVINVAIPEVRGHQDNISTPGRHVPLSCGQRFFSRFTVKTTMPNRSLLERLMAMPRNVYDWLKFEVFIPLTERLILLVSPESPLDRLIAQEKKAIKRVYENIIRNLSLSWRDAIFGFQRNERIDEVNRELDNIHDRFTKHLNEVMRRNDDLSPTQKMQLISALRDVLLSINNTGVDSALEDGELLRGNQITQARARIIHELNEITNFCYREIEIAAYRTETGQISGSLSQCHDALNLSEKSVIRLYQTFKEDYKSTVNDLARNSVLFKHDTESNFTVPNQFDLDFHREGFHLHYPTIDRRKQKVYPVSNDPSEQMKKERAFIEHLKEITGNNPRAIYTACAHINQMPKGATNLFCCRILHQCLGFEFSPNMKHAHFKTFIGADEEHDNKIIIVQKFDIKHHVKHDADMDNGSTGPNSLHVMLPLGRDSPYASLSSYQEKWVDFAMRFETRVTIDLDYPEYALVEQIDPVIHLP